MGFLFYVDAFDFYVCRFGCLLFVLRFCQRVVDILPPCNNESYLLQIPKEWAFYLILYLLVLEFFCHDVWDGLTGK